MKLSWRNPFFIFGLVILWRVLLLVFTVQPIPENDAFFFDGPVVNYVLHGHYFNPALAECFPISGHQIYSAYPPVYQALLTPWMLAFGASAVSAMAFHLMLLTLSGGFVLLTVKQFFPAATNYALVPLLFLVLTFTDRPEDLAHVFGVAVLWLLARKLNGDHSWKIVGALTLTLWAGFYTSVVVGGFYFGAGFLTAALAWLTRRQSSVFVPFIAAAILFIAVTFVIAKTEPLLWRGFLENARQTPVLVNGFHKPQADAVAKLIRSAPVFLFALLLLPVAWARRKELVATENVWLWLTGGIFLMGWAMLALSLVLMSPNYIFYVLNAQILLAAGLLALTGKLFPQRKCWAQVLLVGCVLLLSIRAIGMTTWGAACAWKNSYWQSQKILRTELEPYTKSPAPVILSSAFCYGALELGVERPIHSDWYYDRASGPVDTTGYQAFLKLRPGKLVLTQFDYYRGFTDLITRLQQSPELVTVRVQDFAAVRPPDAIPSLSRVVQHISWAPVVVDLEWK
jgi:hypothetical protein